MPLYRKQIIFDKIYLIHRWGLTDTTNLGGTGSNGNEIVTPHSPELELHHQVQFSVILRRTPGWRGESYPSAGDTVRGINKL